MVSILHILLHCILLYSILLKNLWDCFSNNKVLWGVNNISLVSKISQYFPKGTFAFFKNYANVALLSPICQLYLKHYSLSLANLLSKLVRGYATKPNTRKKSVTSTLN